jgi:hypothetical protein
MLQTYFPHIAALYKKCNDFWKGKGQQYSMDFGRLFFTMAVNMDIGVPVMTVPHVDILNFLYGVCIILAYGTVYCKSLLWTPHQLKHTLPGFYNDGELAWLATKEGKILVQIPTGVPFIFHSAIMMHYNMNIKDIGSRHHQFYFSHTPP